jgi:hypothetical protein
MLICLIVRVFELSFVFILNYLPNQDEPNASMIVKI